MACMTHRVCEYDFESIEKGQFEVTVGNEQIVSLGRGMPAGIHGILQMDTLIFAFHSTCYWDFMKITDA